MTQDKKLPIKIGLVLGSCLGMVVVTIAILRYKTGMILRNEQTQNMCIGHYLPCLYSSLWPVIKNWMLPPFRLAKR